MLNLLPLIIFLLPFFPALSPTKDIDLNILKLLIPLVFIFWLTKSLFIKKILLDHRPRFWLLLIFLFITILSYIWTSTPINALHKILFFLSILPIYFIFYQAQFSKNFLKKFLVLLILSTFILSLIALAQFVSQFIFGLNPSLNFLRNYFSPIFLGHSLSQLVNQYSRWLVNVSGKTILRTFGTFPDPHLFSLYSAMILPLVFYFYQKTYHRRYLIYGFTILLAVLFSFSRAAYLSLIIGSLFFFLNSNPLQLIKKNPLLSYTAFTIIIFIFIIPNGLTARFNSSFNLQEGSNNGRIEMWHIALQTIYQHPITGLGLGGFANQIDSSFGFRNPIYAHNLFLDFGAETGIFNLIILFLLVLSPIIYYLNNKNSLKNTLLAKYLATIFVIFFVHSLFETPFFSIHVFPLFLILLAINPSNKKIART